MHRNRVIRSRFTQIAIALAIVAFVPAQLFAGGEPESSPSPSLVVPTIAYLEGEVTVDGSAAELGMKLAPGASVAVGEDSLCEVIFGRNIVRIYSETTAVIDIGDIRSAIDVERGAIAAVFERVQEIATDGSFQFRTPTTVGGVRGTVFYVRVEGPDSTFVCVCNGEVALDSSIGGDEQVIEAAHHSGLRFIRRADGSVYSEIPEMAYHDDVEMESLAARIDAQIDWTKVD